MISLQSLVYVVVYLIIAGMVFWLCDMGPRFAMDNEVYLGDGNSVFDGELLLSDAFGLVSSSYRANIVIRELCMAMAFAVAHLLLVGGIVHVVGMRAKEQVRWIYAARVVASRTIMANIQAVRYWPIGDDPRRSVRVQNALASTSTVYDAVSSLVDLASPEQAAVARWWAGSLSNNNGKRDCPRSVVTDFAAKSKDGFALAAKLRDRLFTDLASERHGAT